MLDIDWEELAEQHHACGDDETQADHGRRGHAIEEGLEIGKSERHDTHLELETPGERGDCYLNNAKIVSV